MWGADEIIIALLIFVLGELMYLHREVAWIKERVRRIEDKVHMLHANEEKIEG